MSCEAFIWHVFSLNNVFDHIKELLPAKIDGLFLGLLYTLFQFELNGDEETFAGLQETLVLSVNLAERTNRDSDSVLFSLILHFCIQSQAGLHHWVQDYLQIIEACHISVAEEFNNRRVNGCVRATTLPVWWLRTWTWLYNDFCPPPKVLLCGMKWREMRFLNRTALMWSPHHVSPFINSSALRSQEGVCKLWQTVFFWNEPRCSSRSVNTAVVGW